MIIGEKGIRVGKRMGKGRGGGGRRGVGHFLFTSMD